MLSTLGNASVARNSLVERYFHEDYTQAEIIGFLSLRHGHEMSFRTLQRILRNKGLRRQGHKSDRGEVIDAVDKTAWKSWLMQDIE